MMFARFNRIEMADNDTESKQEPMTVQVPSNDVRVRFHTFVNRASVRGDRIIVTRHGQPTAALVSMDDLKKIEAA
jgi:prevent-host-death family protein